jgi:hypothetical protein
MNLTICNLMTNQRIVEVGFIRIYPANRYDLPDGGFTEDFWAAGFTIKNLPTPHFISDKNPNITVTFFDGPG